MTVTRKVAAVMLIAMTGLVLSARASSAEWFADVYAGVSLTQNHDLTIHDPIVGLGVYRDTEFSTAPAYGIRMGRYFDSLPFLGLAVDYFSFSPNIAPQGTHRDGCMLVTGCGSFEGHTGRIDIDARAVSLDLMLRLPLLKTAQEPRGLLQPYLALGAPMFITTVTPRSTRQFRNQDDETQISVGYKGAAGVSYKIVSNLHLFGEYRFTHTSLDLDLHNAVVRNASVDTVLNTHSLLLGLSARW
jgi:opacity protein-like surface antigen